MLVVAAISVDAYPFFFTLSDLICHIDNTGIGVLWLYWAG